MLTAPISRRTRALAYRAVRVVMQPKVMLALVAGALLPIHWSCSSPKGVKSSAGLAAMAPAMAMAAWVAPASLRMKAASMGMAASAAARGARGMFTVMVIFMAPLMTAAAQAG